MVEGGLTDVTTLNPVLADDHTSLAVIELLFDRLLTIDPQTGSLRPGLASSWQVSADGLIITFTLRDDAEHGGEVGVLQERFHQMLAFPSVRIGSSNNAEPDFG